LGADGTRSEVEEVVGQYSLDNASGNRICVTRQLHGRVFDTAKNISTPPMKEEEVLSAPVIPPLPSRSGGAEGGVYHRKAAEFPLLYIVVE